jgi:hypothetical protein
MPTFAAVGSNDASEHTGTLAQPATAGQARRRESDRTVAAPSWSDHPSVVSSILIRRGWPIYDLRRRATGGGGRSDHRRGLHQLWGTPGRASKNWDAGQGELGVENARLVEWVKGLCLRCLADELARQSEWAVPHLVDREQTEGT